MNLRQDHGPLTTRQCREIDEAAHRAKKLGHQLNCLITIMPSLLENPPAELSAFVRKFTNTLRIWCVARFGFHAVWVREAFQVVDSEHLHVGLHCPARYIGELDAALRRWRPGGWEAIDVRAFDPNDLVPYLLKQCLPSAEVAFGGRVWRERDWHGHKVAKVAGKRYGVSRSLLPVTTSKPVLSASATVSAKVTRKRLARRPAPIDPASDSIVLATDATVSRIAAAPTVNDGELPACEPIASFLNPAAAAARGARRPNESAGDYLSRASRDRAAWLQEKAALGIRPAARAAGLRMTTSSSV